MLINASSLRSLFVGFSAAFQDGKTNARSYWRDVAMMVPSTTRENEYGWLSDVPGLREWIGDRVLHGIGVHEYTVKNRLFESTVRVKRTDMEDDNIGVLSPLFRKMGMDAGTHADQLVFEALADGFTKPCYDGRPFFDTAHPVGGAGDEAPGTASNFGGGAGTAWYLLDCSQPIRPLLFQERAPYEMTELTDARDEHVFKTDEYLYGVRARASAGYGLWQLAYGSKAALDATNYAAARAAMMSVKGDNGRPLNVMPTHLVVPPALEAAGRAVLNADRQENGASNIWAGSAQLIVTAWVL